MKMLWIIPILSIIIVCSPTKKESLNNSLIIKDLRCEYLTNPLGIDTSNPRLSWVLDSKDRAKSQTAYRIIVSSLNKNAGETQKESNKGDIWDSGKVESNRTNQIVYDGKKLLPYHFYYWTVYVWDEKGKESRCDTRAFWSMGPMNKSDWKCSWIGMDRKTSPAKTKNLDPGPPAIYFRKAFNLNRHDIKSAMLYSTARGVYNIYFNGSRLSDMVLAPGWTDYDKRIQYQTYSLGKLKTGENVIGAVVGDGWYSGYIGWRKERCHYGAENGFFARIDIEFDDGSKESFVTDQSWKCSEGPIIYSDIMMGELYDARKEFSGWNNSGFDDSGFKQVKILPDSDSQIIAQMSEPVKITEYLKPVALFQPKKGVFVFDLGQNISGWAKIKVKGESGDKISIRYAEKISPDSTIFTDNLPHARATDVYILKGGQEEIYEPSFTFHGFQYVEITGCKEIPELSTFTGCAINSAAPKTGEFQCGNRMVNKLWNNTMWSQRDNFISVPTDCPQRAERLGWMGDALVFCSTASYNMSTAPFYSKWLADVVDGQALNGAYADFSPRIKVPDPIPLEAAPGWGDAGIVVPWTVYRMYGDIRIIDRQWESMEKWMKYIMERNPDYIRVNGGNLEFGDWINVDAETPKDLFATAFWAYTADIMSKMAAETERKKEAEKYSAMHDNIKKSFQKKYISPDGKILGDTQTCYLMSLEFGLIPDSLKAKAEERLLANIKSRDYHLSTGFFGSRYLNPGLTQTGHSDIAYRILLNDTWPSWGYQIKNGATTIWERWDKDIFPKVRMSYNHYSFGAVCEWLYRYVAGIELDPDVAAFRKFTVKPYPSEKLGWVKASYNSINGQIKSEWAYRDSSGFKFSVTIPANTTATVFVPGKDVSKITESGIPAQNARGLKYLRSDDGYVVFEAGSGNYEFDSVY